MPTNVSQFGQLLSSYMHAANLTPGRLAKVSGLTRATIYNWTSGRSPSPRNWRDIVVLANSMGLTSAQTDALLKSATFPSHDLLQNSLASKAFTVSKPAIPFFDQSMLVGDYHAKDCLVDWLSSPVVQPFICIEGMGGIGKTTLALSVIDALGKCNVFEKILWASAKHEQLALDGQIEPLENSVNTLEDVVTSLSEQMGQQQWTGLSAREQLERLRPIFRHKPHLIFIDNLETVSDVDLLLPALSQLGAPTRILLTSRQSLQHFPYVRCYKVQPLSLSDSQQLIDAEIGRIGSKGTVDNSQRTQLLSVIGGLPLALKLVAAQLSYLPLSIVLENFTDSKPASPTEMYQYIYTSVWAQLTKRAQQLLLSLLDNSAEGETFSWVQMTSGLTLPDCAAAIRELLNCSLLQLDGQLADEHRYSLHRMTANFLETQILSHDQQWQQHCFDRQHNNLSQLLVWLKDKNAETVAAHLPSVFTLFEHCQSNAAFHEQIVHLIEALHPWPVRWGNWKRWLKELHFASSHYQQTGDVYKQQLYRLHAAKLSLRLGNTAEVVVDCEEIEQKATKHNWLTLGAMAGELHLQALHTLEQPTAARQLLEQLEEQIGIDIGMMGISAETLFARVHLIWQRMHFLRLDGCIQEAVDLGRRVVEQLAQFPEIDKEIVAKSFHSYGVALWALGDYPASLEAIAYARDLYEAIGDRVEAIIKRDNIGLVYWSMGQLDKAEAAMQESLCMMQDINAQWNIVRLMGNLAVVYMAKGEVAQAVYHLEEQKRLALISNDQYEFFRAESNLTTMNFCQEKPAEYLAFNEPLVKREDISQMTKITVLVELSDVYLALGDAAIADSYITQAQQLLPNVDAICAQIFVLRGLSHHHNKGIDGRQLLEEACQLASQSNRMLDVAACNLDMIAFAQTQREKHNYWTTAETILENMSAKAWLRGRSIDNLPRLPYLY